MSISKCLFIKFWDPSCSQNALKIDQKSTTYQLKNKNNFWHPWGSVFFHFFSSELTFQNWKKCPKRDRGYIFHTSSIFNIQSLLIYFFTTFQYKNQAILMPKSFPNRFQSRWKTKPNFQFTFTTLFDVFGPSIWAPKAAENSQKRSQNFFRHPTEVYRNAIMIMKVVLEGFWSVFGRLRGRIFLFCNQFFIPTSGKFSKLWVLLWNL